MIQITQFPIKKSIYYEITTVLMAKNGGFRNTFSADHKSFGLAEQTQSSTLWHDVILKILARIKNVMYWDHHLELMKYIYPIFILFRTHHCACFKPARLMILV